MSTAQHGAIQAHTPNRNTPQDPAPVTTTVDGAHRRSGLSEWTVRKLISEGKIEARYSGRRVLVVVESLDSYLTNLPSERGE